MGDREYVSVWEVPGGCEGKKKKGAVVLMSEVSAACAWLVKLGDETRMRRAEMRMRNRVGDC